MNYEYALVLKTVVMKISSWNLRIILIQNIRPIIDHVKRESGDEDNKCEKGRAAARQNGSKASPATLPLPWLTHDFFHVLVTPVTTQAVK